MCPILVIKLHDQDIIYFEMVCTFFGSGLQNLCKKHEGKIKFPHFDNMNIDFYRHYYIRLRQRIQMHDHISDFGWLQIFNVCTTWCCHSGTQGTGELYQNKTK